MNNIQIIDELDFGNVPQSSTTTPAAVVAAPVYSAVDHVDWDDAKSSPYSDGLDRIKAPQGEVVRFALVPGIPKVSGLVHWVGKGKDARMYRCGGEQCTACLTGEAKPLHVGMAVQYLGADKHTGKLDPKAKPDYRVGFLSLSKSNLNDILEAPLDGTRPSQVDYVMTNGDGRRYGFRVVGSPALHITRKDTAGIVALAKPLAHLLSKKLGSSMPAVAPAGTNSSSHYDDF